MIQIALERYEVELGDVLRGTATWMPEAGESPRTFYVKLRWRTEGRGTTQEATLWEQRATPTGAPIQIPFAVPLPLDGPPSYDGNLIRIIWELVAGLDVAMRADPTETERLVVRARRLAE